jgi:endonuclease YncB( thermonuclease family)
VCAVYVGPLDAGLEQVRAGYAWHYWHFAEEQAFPERDEFAIAEQRARAARTGLWAEKNPTSPWDWRRARLAEP